MEEISYAVISDIHGNSLALEAVLEDIEKKTVKNIFNLGDTFYGPLDPSGTAGLILQYKMVSILGNQDRILLQNSNKPSNNPTLNYTISSLDSKTFDWLALLTDTKNIDNKFFLCHGTIEKDDAYLLEKVTANGVVLKSADELIEEIKSVESDIIFCGHSHSRRVMQLPNGKLIVNPGSVGLPAYTDDLPYFHCMESGSPHASYCLIKLNERGCKIEQIIIPYNFEKAVEQALKNKRPDWAQWLRTGRG
ncbi:MAG: metallophosphoesterase family protein [Ignavibacteriales bacterium]|nr:metallophosphoesterase family protein [Ignavibacteriales bacterium]